tara:strand:+ start:21 stop:275 length:255 start_codon:yes stop_codon:yes gene_type:complete
MKQKNILLLAGAGALAYYFLVYKKEQNGSSAFSSAQGRRRRLVRANDRCNHPHLRWCARLNKCISYASSCGIRYDKDGKPVGNY